MSYDLYFLEPEACSDAQSADEWLEQNECVPTPESEATKRELVQALMQHTPALTPFPFDYQQLAELDNTSVEEARQLYNHVELNVPDESEVRYQITLYSHYATLTVPYWYEGAQAEAMFSEIERQAARLVEIGGYRIYDPQLECIVDALDVVRGDLLARYTSIVRRLPELVGTAPST